MKLVIGAEITPDDAPPVVLWPTDRAAYGRLARLITLGRRRAEKGDAGLTLDDVAGHSAGLMAGVCGGQYSVLSTQYSASGRIACATASVSPSIPHPSSLISHPSSPPTATSSPTVATSWPNCTIAATIKSGSISSRRWRARQTCRWWPRATCISTRPRGSR